MNNDCELRLGPPERSFKLDVIIVGAGVSGLVTAYRLLEKDPSLQIKILEASDVIGGNLLQIPVGEIGAKWLERSQTHMYKLLQRLEVPMQQRTIKDSKLQRCWELDQGISSNLAKYELQRYINELQLKTPFFKPCRISYLETPNSLVEFDSSLLLKALTQNLGNTEILLSRQVKNICHYKDYVEVHDSAQYIHTTDALILATPLNFIQRINISPQLPVELRNVICNKLDQRKMITSFMAEYNDGHWRKAGYSGNFLKNEPFIVGYEYRPSVYVGLIVHDGTLNSMVRVTVLEALAVNFGEEMNQPHSYNEHTFELSNLGHLPLTTPWNRIIWSSSAAASTCYRGFLGGAVQSGLRAAMNAMLIVRPQVVTWTDVADVHCQNCPNINDVGIVELWMSGLNLYNVGYYTLYASSIILALQFAYKKLG